MRFQCCLYVKGKGHISDVVKASSIEEALTRLISTRDIAGAECGYAHPLPQKKPKSEDWRWNIRNSVSGKVTMSDKKLGKESTKREKASL